MQAVISTLNKWFENCYKNKLFFLIIKYVLISNSRDNNKTNGIGTTVFGLHIDNNHVKSKYISSRVSSRCFAVRDITPLISGTLKLTLPTYTPSHHMNNNLEKYQSKKVFTLQN
jgi:hypothetical protein